MNVLILGGRRAGNTWRDERIFYSISHTSSTFFPSQDGRSWGRTQRKAMMTKGCSQIPFHCVWRIDRCDKAIHVQESKSLRVVSKTTRDLHLGFLISCCNSATPPFGSKENQGFDWAKSTNERWTFPLSAALPPLTVVFGIWNDKSFEDLT